MFKESKTKLRTNKEPVILLNIKELDIGGTRSSTLSKFLLRAIPALSTSGILAKTINERAGNNPNATPNIVTE